MKQTAWLEITKAVNKMEKSQHFLLNNTVMQFQPGNDYIIYSICELLASYWRVTDELLNQPALHSFNYDVSVASLVRGEGRPR